MTAPSTSFKDRPPQRSNLSLHYSNPSQWEINLLFLVMEVIHTAPLGQVNSAQYGWPVTTFPVFHRATRTWYFMTEKQLLNIKYIIIIVKHLFVKLTTTQLSIFSSKNSKPQFKRPCPSWIQVQQHKVLVLLISHPLNPQAMGHRIGISNSYSTSFISHQVIYLWLNLLTQTSEWSEIISGHSTYEWCITFSKLSTLQQIF